MIANAIDKINKESMKQDPLSYKIGDSVRVHVKIKEGDKERVQVFAGTVIACDGGAPHLLWRRR
jgi:large subunit ribosomal protein L19